MHKIHQKQAATKIVLERTARTAATLLTAAMLLIVATLQIVVMLLIVAILQTAKTNLSMNKMHDRVC